MDPAIFSICRARPSSRIFFQYLMLISRANVMWLPSFFFLAFCSNVILAGSNTDQSHHNNALQPSSASLAKGINEIPTREINTEIAR